MNKNAGELNTMMLLLSASSAQPLKKYYTVFFIAAQVDSRPVFYSAKQLSNGRK
jgi:hypothetical protein